LQILNKGASLQNQPVNIRLPRFRASSSVRVEDALRRLGVEDLFDANKADLRLMIGDDEQISLSAIAHK